MWGAGTGDCRGRNSWLPRRVGFVFNIVYWGRGAGAETVATVSALAGGGWQR